MYTWEIANGQNTSFNDQKWSTTLKGERNGIKTVKHSNHIWKSKVPSISAYIMNMQWWSSCWCTTNVRAQVVTPWSVSGIAEFNETKHHIYKQPTNWSPDYGVSGLLFGPTEYLLPAYFPVVCSDKQMAKLDETVNHYNTIFCTSYYYIRRI